MERSHQHAFFPRKIHTDSHAREVKIATPKRLAAIKDGRSRERERRVSNFSIGRSGAAASSMCAMDRSREGVAVRGDSHVSARINQVRSVQCESSCEILGNGLVCKQTRMNGLVSTRWARSDASAIHRGLCDQLDATGNARPRAQCCRPLPPTLACMAAQVCRP